MNDLAIITIVVVVVLGAHGWLFLWIKFKIDEGSIIKFLKEHEDKNGSDVEAISLNASIAAARVARVCTKSKAIKRNVMEKELWCLN